MSRIRVAAVSLIVALAAWALFSWPLAWHAATAIPSSSQNIEKYGVRTMIPGDHLQLLYNFWLVGDMAAGRTPLFSNLYEFNTGDDAERRDPKPYFVPSSLFYAAAAWFGGQAVGWNAASLVSLWLMMMFTWLLTRRYAGEPAAFAAATISVGLPFVWVNLLGGSPAGFALAWVPPLMLGMDLAIRDRRVGGGVLVGLGLAFASFTDPQVFYYSLLSLPLWGLCILAAGDLRGRTARDLVRGALALWPAAVLGGAALAIRFLRHQSLVDTSRSAGREVREIALFSPPLRGLWAWQAEGVTSHVYIGWVLPAILLAGLIALLAVSSRARDRKRLGAWGVFALVTGVLVALSLGVRGPVDGLAMRLARKFLPAYTMVRQPDKVFSLFPTFLSLFAALSLGACFSRVRRAGARAVLAAAVVAALAFEYGAQVRATVCELDDEQGAYRAVAESSRAAGEEPRALILPIWPGDSSWSSLYEHYVSLYRIRMINGYSPFVRKDYYDNIFRGFSSGNQGVLEESQLRDLLARGIRYILVHEDAFPEKVSPFPVGLTLKRLRNNPRLEFLARDGAVSAFRIRGEAAVRPPEMAGWKLFGAARRWEAEASVDGPGEPRREDTAGRGGYARLDGRGAAIRTAPTRVAAHENVYWLVRLRGRGAFRCETWGEADLLDTAARRIDTNGWTWVEIPFEDFEAYGPLSLRLEVTSGTVDADMVLLTSEPWLSAMGAGSWVFPAAVLFHAGVSDPDTATVTLRKDREPVAIAFYGPKLPFPAGVYEIEIAFESAAPAGTELARFNIRREERDEDGWVVIEAGRRALARFEQKENVPLFAAVLFQRNADLKIHHVRFERVE